MENEIENASLKTAERAAQKRTKLLKKIGYNLELLTIYELEIVDRYVEARFHI